MSLFTDNAITTPQKTERTSDLLKLKALSILGSSDTRGDEKKIAMGLMKTLLTNYREQELSQDEQERKKKEIRRELEETEFEEITATLMAGSQRYAQAGTQLLGGLREKKEKLKKLYDAVGTREYNLMRRTQYAKDIGYTDSLIKLLSVMNSSTGQEEKIRLGTQLMQVARLMRGDELQEELIAGRGNDLAELQAKIKLINDANLPKDERKKLLDVLIEQLTDAVEGGGGSGGATITANE